MVAMPKGNTNSGVIQLSSRRSDHSGEKSREQFRGTVILGRKSVLCKNVSKRVTELQRDVRGGVVGKIPSHIHAF